MKEQSKKGHLIAIGGMSGSGKSTVAKTLAQNLSKDTDIILLQSDVVRKELWGVPETTTLPDEAYTWDNTKQLIAEMDKRIRQRLDEGKTVILDALFIAEGPREKQEELAQQCNAEFSGILLTCDTETLIKRVEERAYDDNNISDITPDLMIKQLEYYSEETDWKKITANKPLNNIMHEVLSHVRKTPETAVKTTLKSVAPQKISRKGSAHAPKN